MRHLISTLQTHNQQLKGEVVKYKLRLREAQRELSRLRAAKGNAAIQSQSSTEMDAPTVDVTVKTEPDSSSTTHSSAGGHIQSAQDDREGQETCGEHSKWR